MQESLSLIESFLLGPSFRRRSQTIPTISQTKEPLELLNIVVLSAINDYIIIKKDELQNVVSQWYDVKDKEEDVQHIINILNYCLFNTILYFKLKMIPISWKKIMKSSQKTHKVLDDNIVTMLDI